MPLANSGIKKFNDSTYLVSDNKELLNFQKPGPRGGSHSEKEIERVTAEWSEHRLPKLKSRLFDVFRAADSTYVVYATACVYREMYGKITESLKSGK